METGDDGKGGERRVGAEVGRGGATREQWERSFEEGAAGERVKRRLGQQNGGPGRGGWRMHSGRLEEEGRGWGSVGDSGGRGWEEAMTKVMTVVFAVTSRVKRPRCQKHPF